MATQEEVDYVQQIEGELQGLRSQNLSLNRQTYDMNNQILHNPETQNLIQWQLDLQNDFDKIKHLLRGDVIATDQEGMPFWESNKSVDERPLNDRGVNELMRILHLYVNRNTLLAYYEPEEIDVIVGEAGQEINDTIFFNLDEFGLDTVSKRKNISMIHHAMIDFILSAYKRAQWGGERDSLRTARHVTQSDNSMNPQRLNNSPIQPQRSFSLLRPSTWSK